MTPASIDRAHAMLVDRLLAARTRAGHWEGDLSSSALSTATAVVALSIAREHPADRALVDRGLDWLAHHQNADGGWGDTTASRSNISTTALGWSAFAGAATPAADAAVQRCEAWLSRAAGGLDPRQLKGAIEHRYGKDRTFSVPILTTLALTGRLGDEGWQYVPQLPFELAACPPEWFQWLQLPVVSYALPALIAMGQARHHNRRSRNPLATFVRDRVRAKTSLVLRRIQPSSGGYLEAIPLTSFVVMSLAGAGQARSTVAQEGLRFLREAMRADGSWPIDINLATWVTTLAVNALAASAAGMSALDENDRTALTRWLLDQQHLERHPYTQAAPGGWAWTPLPGGVPDADDTAGAVLALAQLGATDPRAPDAAVMGAAWLLDLQNRDGGIPTFCRGWGALPFDRSAPDLTAHALLAWAAWRSRLSPALEARVRRATIRAARYLAASQQPNGFWLPLWFGNEHAPGEENPVYGTSKVVLALAALDLPQTRELIDRGARWLCDAQNADGGWGGAPRVESTIEETAFAVDALASVGRRGDITPERAVSAVARGADYLMRATAQGTTLPPAPIGLYFAKLWYSEALYPLIFAVGALGRASERPLTADYADFAD